MGVVIVDRNVRGRDKREVVCNGLVCRLSTGHVKTHLPLTSSHCAHKRIIYKSLTFSKIVNCRANAKGPDNLDREGGGEAKWRLHHQQIFSLLAKCFDLQFMKLTLKCHPSLTLSLSLYLSLQP